MANKRQKNKALKKAAWKLAKAPRMTVEYLMETYNKEELMRIFRYHMINKVTVLTQLEVTKILAMDEDDPRIKRREPEDIEPNPK